MIPLDDTRWNTLGDALGTRFECGKMLRQLLTFAASDEIWDLCWNHLVYQEEIGEVSYAAVPYLARFVQNSKTIDWNALALISAIELARPTGPKIPSDVSDEYFLAIKTIPSVLANHPSSEWDELTTRSAVSCIALAKGQRELAKAIRRYELRSRNRVLRRQSE